VARDLIADAWLLPSYEFYAVFVLVYQVVSRPDFSALHGFSCHFLVLHCHSRGAGHSGALGLVLAALHDSEINK